MLSWEKEEEGERKREGRGREGKGEEREKRGGRPIGERGEREYKLRTSKCFCLVHNIYEQFFVVGQSVCAM